MNSYDIICPYNPILCVKFLPHSSHLYFLKPFIDIYHGHFKIFLSNNFFCTNFTLEFCRFSKCQWCSYAWGLFMNILLVCNFKLNALDFFTILGITFFLFSWIFCICNFKLYPLAIFVFIFSWTATINQAVNRPSNTDSTSFHNKK